MADYYYMYLINIETTKTSCKLLHTVTNQNINITNNITCRSNYIGLIAENKIITWCLCIIYSSCGYMNPKVV